MNVGWVNADGQVSVNGGTMTVADGYHISGELEVTSGSLSMPGNNYVLTKYSQSGGTVNVAAVQSEEANDDGSYYWEGLTIRGTGNVSGGALNFAAENGENDWTNGLQVLEGGSLTISGGTVTSTVNRGNAVFVSGGSNLKVSGTGELNATVSGTDSAAVQLYGDMTVSGGSLTAEGEVACEVGNDRNAEGVLGNLTVSNGVVNLNGTYRGLRIQDGAAVTLNGGQVNAAGYIAVMMRNWLYDENGDVVYQENPDNPEEGTWVPDLENPSKLTVTGGTHTFTGTNADVTESLNAYYSKIYINGGTVNLRNHATEAGWALNCLSDGANSVLMLGEGIHAVYDTGAELTPVSVSEDITWLGDVDPYFVTFTTDNQPVNWETPNLASNVTITTRDAAALMGDVNGDGEINAADAAQLAGALIGLDTLDENAFARADLNGDEKLTAADAVLLAKLLLQSSEEETVSWAYVVEASGCKTLANMAGNGDNIYTYTCDMACFDGSYTEDVAVNETLWDLTSARYNNGTEFGSLVRYSGSNVACMSSEDDLAVLAGAGATLSGKGVITDGKDTIYGTGSTKYMIRTWDYTKEEYVYNVYTKAELEGTYHTAGDKTNLQYFYTTSEAGVKYATYVFVDAAYIGVASRAFVIN